MGSWRRKGLNTKSEDCFFSSRIRHTRYWRDWSSDVCSSDLGWFPKQRVSLPDAIKAYTLGAAFAGHFEKTQGSFEPGKVADLIILSQDLFKIEPTDIAKADVLLTMVGGKVVYQSPAWNSAPATGAK